MEEHPYSQNSEDYDIGNAIGFGSSAIVYIATYKPLKTPVAIKMIELDRFERNQIDELRKEILVMSLCKNENLLQVLASFVNESKLWIVTPYMSLGSCLDLLKNYFKDGMDEKFIQIILYQALLGLDYLHKNGHIHRDVKAGNLLIQGDGFVKLADFGVTSCLMEDTRRRGSLRKTFVGTPCWMAPEVMEMTRGYNCKADIWSFGITALEMAYGAAPLSKYPPMKVIYMILSNASNLTLDRNRTKNKYSKTFKSMIDACLQRDPAKRPTTEALMKHPFFKPVRKNWGEGRDCAPIQQLRELVSSMTDVHTRAANTLAGLPHHLEDSDSLSETDDGEVSTDIDDISQSSWDFDDEQPVGDVTIKFEDPNQINGNSPEECYTHVDLSREDSFGPLSPPLSGDQEALLATAAATMSASNSLKTEIKKGRFSVIDTASNSAAASSSTSPAISLSTPSPSSLDSKESSSDLPINKELDKQAKEIDKQAKDLDKQPLAKLTEDKTSLLKEKLSDRIKIETFREETPSYTPPIVLDSEDESRKPGLTLEKRFSRFKITNEQLKKANIVSREAFSLPLSDFLKSLKDFEKNLIGLYEELEYFKSEYLSARTEGASIAKENALLKNDLTTLKVEFLSLQENFNVLQEEHQGLVKAYELRDENAQNGDVSQLTSRHSSIEDIQNNSITDKML